MTRDLPDKAPPAAAQRSVRSLGTISYMMYLSHQSILNLVGKLGLPAGLRALLALLAVILWSSLSAPLRETVAIPQKQKGAAYSGSCLA